MNGLRYRTASTLLLTLAAAGCTCIHKGDLVVVLREADGKVGSISVNDGHSTQVLDRDLAAVEMRGGGRARPAEMSAEEVHAIFGAAIDASPLAPVHFTLFFDEGTERLTAASEEKLSSILADIKRRAASEIEAVGHTDRVGSEDDNAALSLRRAGAVRDWLIASGVAAGAIRAVGRGELDPAVATADGVEEPRNRRVEVAVR